MLVPHIHEFSIKNVSDKVIKKLKLRLKGNDLTSWLRKSLDKNMIHRLSRIRGYIYEVEWNLSRNSWDDKSTPKEENGKRKKLFSFKRIANEHCSFSIVSTKMFIWCKWLQDLGEFKEKEINSFLEQNLVNKCNYWGLNYKILSCIIKKLPELQAKLQPKLLILLASSPNVYCITNHFKSSV